MADHPTCLALIPARAGSLRVPNKNVRPLAGHPLIAYTIAGARLSGLFKRIVVSTNSAATADIARYYGAEVPFTRPDDFATSTSPDIEWLKHALSALDTSFDCFSILRPTSPFRQADTIQRAWQKFLSTPGADSLRAVELCQQHPGKMWTIDGPFMEPVLDQSNLAVPWHDGQYQALPKVYVQNSSLEIAWTRVVWQLNTRGGRVIAPFLTNPAEGFSIDLPSDWVLAEHYVSTGEMRLPVVDCPPYSAQQPS
jgi:CMP-N,N'-diacetyllegionaminic acid synthase